MVQRISFGLLNFEMNFFFISGEKRIYVVVANVFFLGLLKLIKSKTIMPGCESAHDLYFAKFFHSSFSCF